MGYAALAGAALAWNIGVGPSLPVGPRGRAITNAVVGVGFAAMASRGRRVEEIGMTRFAGGFALGSAVSVVPLTGYAVAALVPGIRKRVASLPPEDKPGECLSVRIPLGTVVCEELIFRSALDGVGTGVFGRVGSSIAGSVVFGIWHLPVARGRLSTLVATGLGGVLFGYLRHRSGSVIAPALLHYSLNAGGAGLRVYAARRRSRADT